MCYNRVMQTQYVIQKLDADGLRLFITEASGEYGEFTRSRHAAKVFSNRKDAEQFRKLNNLESFGIVEWNGTDDKQEWARLYWENRG